MPADSTEAATTVPPVAGCRPHEGGDVDLQLAGRTALVTGSSAGIGAVVASELAAEGCHVLVHGRGADGVAQQVDRIRVAGGTATGVTGDLEDAASTDTMLAEARAVATVDILVANAGR